MVSLLEIAPVNRQVIAAALQSRFRDFEDAVLSESARLVSADAIVTRNQKDFSHAHIPVYTPEELLHLLDSDAIPDDQN